MNSTTNILITTLLAFALLSSITTSAVFATGNLDDEEEEEVLEELQTAIQEIQGTLGTLTLNLTEGSNNIEANCPTTAEIVEEVLENITESQPPVQNVTEPVQNVTEPQQCPIVQEPQQNNTVVEPPQQTILPPAEAVEEEQNQTQGCNPVPEEPQQNTTEIIEEVIENVTDIPEVECNIVQEEEQAPQTNQSVIPGIVLPNITEPVEPVTPVQNETQQCNPVPEEPVQENETVSELEPIYCPINGELLGYTNTTSGEQLPISAGQQQVIPEVSQPIEQGNQTTVQDEQEIASIEFEAQCGCFVIDKTPEDLSLNGGSNESVEQGLYTQ